METNNTQAFVVQPEQQQASTAAPVQTTFIPPAKINSPNEPNNRFVRNNRPNYFRRQEKKNGPNWVDKAYPHLEKDIPFIVRDFIEGNISEADVMYLFNGKIWYKMSNTVYDRLTKSGFRVEANKAFTESIMRQNGTVPQYFIGLRNADENEYYVWREFQAYLENFSTLSRYPDGGAQVIKYTLGTFIPALARYRGIVL